MHGNQSGVFVCGYRSLLKGLRWSSECDLVPDPRKGQ